MMRLVASESPWSESVGILDHADGVAVLPQLVVDALPAGAVDKTSVHDDDVR
jgi:hypothetical protein